MAAEKKVFTDMVYQNGASLVAGRAENVTSYPASPYVGQFVFRTDLDTFCIFTATGWVCNTASNLITWLNAADFTINYLTTGGIPTGGSGETVGEIALDATNGDVYTYTPGGWNSTPVVTGTRMMFNIDGTGTGFSNATEIHNNNVYQTIITGAPTVTTPVSGDAIINKTDLTKVFVFDGAEWIANAWETTTASAGTTMVGQDVQLYFPNLTAGIPNIGAGGDIIGYTDLSDPGNIVHEKVTFYEVFNSAFGGTTSGLTLNSNGTVNVSFASVAEAKTGTEAYKATPPSALVDHVWKYSNSFVAADWGSIDGGLTYTLTVGDTTSKAGTIEGVTAYDATGNEVIVGVLITGGSFTLISNGSFDGGYKAIANGYTP